MASTQSEILHKILINQEDNLNKCLKSVSILTKYKREGDHKLAKTALNAALTDLGLTEHGIRAEMLALKAINQEETSFAQKHVQVADNLEQTKQQITQLKLDLQREQVIRQNKEEYAALAKLINAYPARKSTEAQLSSLQSEVQELTQVAEQTEAKLDLTSRRFGLFFHATQQLQVTLIRTIRAIRAITSVRPVLKKDIPCYAIAPGLTQKRERKRQRESACDIYIYI